MACVLCGADEAREFTVAPKQVEVAVCDTCRDGLENGPQDVPHWQCLNEAIWSEESAVKVLAWRLLNALDALWAKELLEIAYLEPDDLDWAQAGVTEAPDVVHRDSNGVVLVQGDTVVLIKDLNVKGAGFTAKRGTSVRGISLVADNAEHIEGRVEGQRIVILTQFVKKS
ncbi:phosphonoacetate hydrolase [Puniceibacterium sediminis]|uniref:Phosphonoacetate hydrolase n=1 Tax=Puniceibacterium sediminis TaxID=1608407 RepID=A0A238Z013_9RHOB|nr:alkylphosphonate utilization protein [Puniceibacterium sediminis]SNR76258.1 phosphonoacetate hydrolase [Puniceibacterium sediminis]